MRFSYAVVALIGAAHAMVCYPLLTYPLTYPPVRLDIIPLTHPKPRVGSLITGRSVCNTEDCQGVARAVVADQAALEARRKSKAAKGAAANATAKARSVNDSNDKRSKNLFQEEARALGDAVDNLVGDVTGTVGDVTDTVGLKTRDGKEVRAAVKDDAALDARKQSKAAKSAASNATAEARSVHEDRAAVTDDAAIDARQQSKAAKSAASNSTAEARSVNHERAAVTDDAAIDARQQSKAAKSAASNATAEARSVNNEGRSANLMHDIGADGAALTKKDDAGTEAPKSRKSRKSRRSHQLW